MVEIGPVIYKKQSDPELARSRMTQGGKKNNIGGFFSNNNNTRRKGTPIWFYIDGRLHKRISVDRSNDVLKCWDFTEQRPVVYALSSAKLRMRPCFNTNQVGALINRNPHRIRHLLADGELKEPMKACYPGRPIVQSTRWRWSEDDVMAARDYFAGKRHTDNIPTRRELRALMNQEDILYIQQGDGSFAPTWRAKDF